jgi:tRNA(Phe) wybutosine-synthesizing methylase Tyw3
MIQDKIFELPEDIDFGCVSLITRLNQIPGIETTECCCGHLRAPYMVFFQCNDFTQLGRLYRCVK